MAMPDSPRALKSNVRASSQEMDRQQSFWGATGVAF
jgi:hypothetical protein